MVAKGRFAMRPGITFVGTCGDLRRRLAHEGSLRRRGRFADDPGLGAEVQRAWPRGARGPPSAGPSWQAEHRPTPGSGSDGRERSDACDPWGRTLATERLGDVGLGGVPGLGVTTLSRILRALGYRKLSARPRHHAQAAGAVDAFKKRSPSAWMRSRATRGSIATG